MVLLRHLMLPVITKVLVTIRRAAAAVLWATIMVHLLRACSKVLRARVVVTSGIGHCETGLALWDQPRQASFQLTLACRLLGRKDWLLVRYVRTHPVNRLALLRPLRNHQWCCWASWTWISVGARERLRRCTTWGKELSVCSRVHLHLRSSNHAVRPCHELRLHHHGATHVAGLLWHKLGVVGKTPVPAHLRRAGATERLHHRLAVWHLSRGVHRRWVCHGHLCHAGRGE